MSNLIGLLEFHIALSEILLTACSNQLIYNLNLIKLCSACAKQIAAVNASDACSLLAKEALFDLVGQHPTLLIINFEQVINYFLVWNIYFIFFLPVVDCTFLLEYWRVTSWKYSLSNIAQTSSLCYVADF